MINSQLQVIVQKPRISEWHAPGTDRHNPKQGILPSNSPERAAVYQYIMSRTQYPKHKYHLLVKSKTFNLWLSSYLKSQGHVVSGKKGELQKNFFLDNTQEMQVISHPSLKSSLYLTRTKCLQWSP